MPRHIPQPNYNGYICEETGAHVNFIFGEKPQEINENNGYCKYCAPLHQRETPGQALRRINDRRKLVEPFRKETE